MANNKESIGTLLFLVSLLLIPLELFAQHTAAQNLELFSQQSLALQHAQLIEDIETESGPYDYRLSEPLQSLAHALKKSGDYEEANKAYSRALHISRVNEGLYNSNQIPIVEDLISVSIATADWEAVNNNYDYLELLYRRVYDEQDSELALGLEKINAWHVDAVNVDLDGKRIMHLRHAHKLFKLRLSIAQRTNVAMEDPIFEFLKHNIALSEYYLYMFAGENGSIMNRKLESGYDSLAITD